jgi:tetratricopeptide (TPR) repeat protein
MRVARVQGVPISPTLGQEDQAEQNLRIADRFIQSVLKVQPANRTAMLRAAQIAHDRMILARFQGHFTQALGYAREAAGWLEKFHAGKEDKPESSAILNTYLNVADQFKSEQKYDEALLLCHRGDELAAAFNLPAERGNFLWVSALVFRERGQLDKALQNIHQSVKLLDPGANWLTKGGQTRNFMLALIYEGRILGEYNSVSLGRPEEAVKPLARAFRMADELVHRDRNDHSARGSLAMAGISLGNILRHSDAPRALEIFDHTLRHLAEAPNDMHLQRFAVNALAGSSYALRRMGRFAKARHRLDTAFQRLKQLQFYPAEKVYPGSELQETLQALADQEADTGHLTQAIGTYQTLLDRLQPAESGLQPSLDDSVQASAIYQAASALYRRADRSNLASAMETKRRNLWRNWERQLPNNSFVHREFIAALR